MSALETPKPVETSEQKPTQFLLVQEIDWLSHFVDKKRKTWLFGVKYSLTTLSNKHQLPTIEVRSKSSGSKFSTAYSIEAVKLLKAQMEKHPENFVNGRMLKYYD